MTDKIIINVARLTARALALVCTRVVLALVAVALIPVQLIADIVMIVIRLAKTPTNEVKLGNVWWASPSSVLMGHCADTLKDDIF